MLLLRNCQLARDPLNCHLDAILRVLYVTAFVLAVVLLVVVWAAVRLYRKNRTAKIVNAIDDE